MSLSFALVASSLSALRSRRTVVACRLKFVEFVDGRWEKRKEMMSHIIGDIRLVGDK